MFDNLKGYRRFLRFSVTISVVLTQSRFVIFFSCRKHAFPCPVMQFSCCHSYVVFTTKRARGNVDHIGSLAQAWCSADFAVACFTRAVSCWTFDEVVNCFAAWVNDTSWNVMFFNVLWIWWFIWSETNGIFRVKAPLLPLFFLFPPFLFRCTGIAAVEHMRWVTIRCQFFACCLDCVFHMFFQWTPQGSVEFICCDSNFAGTRMMRSIV